MKRVTFFLLLAVSALRLSAAEPSNASLDRLLAVTEVEKLLNSVYPQVDAMMKTSMEQALRGKTLPPEANDFVTRFQQKMMVQLKEELNWETMKPLYLRLYRETFTQEEVDGMLAFYQSPAGKALVAKMPTLMQKSMVLMQERMGPLMEKIQRSIQESLAEVQALSAKASATPAR